MVKAGLTKVLVNFLALHWTIINSFCNFKENHVVQSIGSFLTINIIETKELGVNLLPC
jgi:hypothetical protein